MKIYYEEVIHTEEKSKFNYFEIEHDQRHKFWQEHPKAVEVSKKYYFEIMRLSTQKDSNADSDHNIS